MTTYTANERRRFKRVLDNTGSLRNETRVMARLQMKELVAEWGMPKCGAIFASIERAAKRYGASEPEYERTG